MNPLPKLVPDVSAAIAGEGSSQRITQEQLRRSTGIADEQVQGLVHQLFLRRESTIRHAGFTAIEETTETGQLCLDVASMLAEIGSHDIGLIDARLRSSPLSIELGLDSDSNLKNVLQLMPGLWLVPRAYWIDDNSAAHVWDSSLSCLRMAILKFDYAVVAFDSLNWLTARISPVCDGLVLVATAQRTRRLVATQIRERLKAARVPVLGTVLAERRFPVPERLYRKL